MSVLTKESHIATIRPHIDAEWLQLLDAYDADLFHSPEWIDVLIKTYGFDIKANILIDPAQGVVAGLPFVSISDIYGSRNSSLPFCDFFDPLVQTKEQWDLLVEGILSEGVLYKIRPLHQPIPLVDERFQITNRARWHGLNLAPEPDNLWAGMHNSVRTGVRKATKNDVEVCAAETEADLRLFYDMHLGIRKNKYRMVAQPFEFFLNIWKRFLLTGNGKLMLAYHQNNVIAGMMFLRYRNTLYYKFSASVPARLSVNPNELLMWTGIQYAKECGCTYLDFGLSGWDQDGLNFFKRKFAKDEKAITFLQYSPHGAHSQSSNGFKTLLPHLTDLFTDESVPNDVTEKAGALLYKYFA